MAKDPVCGMQVDERKPTATYPYKGETYYFCSLACKKLFKQEPKQYLGKQAAKSRGHSSHGHSCH